MEENAVSKLPLRLQEEFFKLAEEAAAKAAEHIRRERERLNNLRRMLRFRRIPRHGDVKKLRVGVVDGSLSPELAERLGYRMGIYTASYMVFEDGRIISDKDRDSMVAGYLMGPQTGSSLHTKKILSLLRTLTERKMAKKCIKEYDVDLMIIDGSFYGFRTRCSEVKRKDLTCFEGIEGFRTGLDLIEEVYEISRELAENGKTIGVVKRLRTQAIDGWLLSKRWRTEDMIGKNDKAILRAVLRPGEYFDYRDLLGEWSYLHYTGLVTWIKEIRRKFRKISGEEKLKVAFEHVNRKLGVQIGTDLCPDRREIGEDEWRKCRDEKVKNITGMRRVYAKLAPYAQPICVEFSEAVDLELVLAYLKQSINEATGLPFPLDLIDANIGVDRGIAREFAEEVEARLLLEERLEAEEVRGEFTSLNPQKEE